MRSWMSKCKNQIGICLLILAIGIISDVLVYCCNIIWFPVSNDYINEVFSAACTVATLSLTLLSFLFGFSERTLLGIPFQDILHFSFFGCRQNFTITITALSIPCAIFAYACKLNSTLTMLFVMDTVLVFLSCRDLWKIYISEDYRLKLINEIITDRKNARYEVYLDNWFHELENSLASNSESIVQEFCNRLSKITSTASDEEHPINNSISRHLPHLFEIACEKIGFVSAYAILTRINKIRPNGFVDSEELAKNYLESLKYSGTGDIHIQSLPTAVEAIIEQMELEKWEKINLVYNCFCAVFYNSNLLKNAKHDLLAGILDCICYLRENDFEDIKQQVLRQIVKREIILNDNEDSRAALFHMLTASLLRRNRHEDNPAYISVVAEIYRAFYFYIFHEKESITKEYRNGLLSLYKSEQTQKDLIAVSYNYLVKDQVKNICTWLAKDSAKYNRNRSTFWDYFSPAMEWKRMVWSDESTIRFAFCFFSLLSYGRAENPFVEILDSDSYTEIEKIKVCEVITQLYEQGQLNQHAKDTIQEIETMTEIPQLHSDYFARGDSNYFQNKLSELLTTANRHARELSVTPDEEIRKFVQKELDENGVFDMDDNVPLRHCTHRHLIPDFVEISSYQQKQSTQRIAHNVKQIMDEVISRKLPEVRINFGLEGVHTLLEKLTSGGYQYRNYTFVDDYGITAAVRETADFKTLCEYISKIPFDRNRDIQPYVFLKEPKVRYNLKVKYKQETPSEEDCAKYVKHRQIAEGTYQIGSHRFDYSHAVGYVMNNFRLEFVDVLIRVEVNKDSGFKVNFIRTK